MTVFFDDRRQALLRALAGGILGMAFCLLLGWLLQPGAFFGAPLTFDFTFCMNSRVPELPGTVLCFLLWFLFGAETGVATLPFADEGKALLFRSLAHFAAMTLTMWAWVLLNFPYEPLPGLALTFQLPFTLIYILIWLGRWVGWYAEVAQIRERLGLSPGPSFLRWKETLPHILFAALLCLGVPLVLLAFDAPDVPVLIALLYTWLLLPVGSFFPGLSLGRRQGVCPLYPLSCAGFSALFSLLLRLRFRGDFDLRLLLITLCFSLMGDLLGAIMKTYKGRRAP